MRAQGIIGPFFFGDAEGMTAMVNQQKYQEVLKQIIRCLQQRCADMFNLQWLKQDGALAHTTKKTLEWLTECMGGRVISKGATISWPPQSPDLTPPDFFLRGHIKQMVCRDNPSTLTELKAAI